MFGTHENFRVYAWLYSHAAALLDAAERAETAEQDLYIVRATLGRYAEKVQDAEAALAEAAEQNQRYKEALAEIATFPASSIKVRLVPSIARAALAGDAK